MSYIIIISYISLFYITTKYIQDKISKWLMLLYTSYWCISLFIYSLGYLNLYKIEDTTYYLLIGHLFAFLFGFVIVKPSPKIVSMSATTDLDVIRILKHPIFIFLFAACFIFVYRLFLRQSELLYLFSLSDIRGDFIEMVLSGGSLYFYEIVAKGMFHFCLCMAFYMLFFERKWLYIVPLITYSLLYAFLGGGRHQFVQLIYYAIGFIILKDFILSSINRKIKVYVFPKKVKMGIFLAVISSVIVMSMFTALRHGEDGYNKDTLGSGSSDLYDTFVSYSTGPFVAFDKGLKMKRFSNDRYYGTATFGGTEYVLYTTILQYFIPDYERSYKKVTSYIQENRISISPDSTWNYAYTSCFYYYCDFGYIGIIMFPFVLGLSTRLIINTMENRLTIYSIALYIFISFCLYDSIFTCYLHKRGSIIYILFLLLMNKVNFRWKKFMR